MEDTDKRSVMNAMAMFESRAREIINRIDGKRSIGAFEKDELQSLYTGLKEDVKSAAKLGKVHKDREDQTDWERCYFMPAVSKARDGLRAKTNSHPVTSNWIGSLLDAAGEFSYYLSMIERDHPEDQ
jgi:hypothetical protein